MDGLTLGNQELSDTVAEQCKSENPSLNAQLYAAALRLDGPTLGNLELLENQENGECTGSLLARLDSCASAGALLCHRPLRPKPYRPGLCQCAGDLRDETNEAALPPWTPFAYGCSLGGVFRSS